MPVELLHLTAAYLGFPVEVPYETSTRRADIPILAIEYHDRTDHLRVLSQTCYQLRQAFLPLLWDCMNICAKSRKGGPFYQTLGDLLKRTSEGLAGEPELLSYIRWHNDHTYLPYISYSKLTSRTEQSTLYSRDTLPRKSYRPLRDAYP